MDAVGTIASVILGAVFLFAGGSKIAAGESWRRQARELGAPSFVAPFVPWVEIVVGALFVSQIAGALVALAAIALLVAFTALIVVRLAQGRHPACACFGAWSATPIGAIDVLRNLSLIALAIVTLAA